MKTEEKKPGHHNSCFPPRDVTIKGQHELLPLIKRMNQVSVSTSSLLSAQLVFEGISFGKCVTFTHGAALN